LLKNKFMMRIFIAGTLMAVTLLALPTASFAATCDPTVAGIQCPLEGEGISEIFFVNLINKVANWLFTFLLVLAVVFIVIAAYKYMFSQGSDEAVTAAHKMLIYAVVAVAVAMLSRGFVFVVRGLITGTSSTPTASSTPPAAQNPIVQPTGPSLKGFDIVTDSKSPPTFLNLSDGILTFTNFMVEQCNDGWVPAVKIGPISQLQAGCTGLCSTHKDIGTAYDSYALSPSGVTVQVQRCLDDHSPIIQIGGQRFP